MRDDLLTLEHRTQIEVNRYHEGTIDIEDLCFWHKSLVRAFLAQVESLCNTMREVTAQLAPELGVEISATKLREISEITKQMPIRKNFSIAFRNFPKLFGVDFVLETGGENFRAFKAVVEARDRFTHPKNYRDICPFELFAATVPAMKWFLITWKNLIISCSSALGVRPTESKVEEQKFIFQDERLRLFVKARERFDAKIGERPPRVELDETLGRLLRDTRLALGLFKESRQSNSSAMRQCAARNLLRTAFSEIEGSVFVAALHLHRFAVGYKSPAKELLIGGHHDVRERIAQVLEEFSREFGRCSVLSRAGAEWDSFVISREIRNRLTHPKRTVDLDMSPLEEDVVISLLRWWHLEASDCLDFAVEVKE